MNNLKKNVGKLLGGDKFSSGVITALVIAVVMVFNALLFTIVELCEWQVSYKQKNDYSLSGTTDEMFKEAISAGKKVKISFCMAEDEVRDHSTGGEVYITAKNFAERYADSGFIELDYINIIKRVDKDGKLVNLSKYKTEDKDGNTVQQTLYKTSVIFECGENYRVLTDTYTSAGFSQFYTLDSSKYVTSYNGEEIMAAMISWVLTNEHKTVYFTQRHGESSDLAFSNLVTCAGYNIDVIDLRSKSVPEDAAFLVISNPTSDFEAARPGSGVYAEMDRLRAYVERGGQLYVTLDPYVKTLPVLEGFLAEYGISFSSSTDSAGKKIRNLVKENDSAITPDGFTITAHYADSALADAVEGRVEKYNTGGVKKSVILREISALELSGNAKPLLVSSASSTLEAGGSAVSRTGSYTIAAYSETPRENGKTSKIFVMPSIYLAVSDSVVSNRYANKDFVYSIFEDFFGARNMPYGCKIVNYNSQVLENLTMGTARIYTAVILAIPVAVAVCGAVIITKRKNR